MSFPSIFIVYSWDQGEVSTWVKLLAKKLEEYDIQVTIDQRAAVLGEHIPKFMETAITSNDYVLIVCTPQYKQKSDERTGGVGFEGDIITGEILHNNNHRKFIPILFQGTWQESAPSWLQGKYY